MYIQVHIKRNMEFSVEMKQFVAHRRGVEMRWKVIRNQGRHSSLKLTFLLFSTLNYYKLLHAHI